MKYIVHIEHHATDKIEVEAESKDKARELAMEIAMSPFQPREIDSSIYKVEEVGE